MILDYQMANQGFTKYPSIEQFRSVVKEVNCHFEPDAKPIITFEGTVKLHGTNGGVSWSLDPSDQIMSQSRNRQISIENDNAGFACFCNQPEVQRELKRLMISLSEMMPPQKGETLYLFGEWCGRGIQRGVAIAQLNTMYVIFGAAYRFAATEDNDKRWFSAEHLRKLVPNPECHIYQIYQFPHWKREIKFCQPELGEMQNELTKITEQVEAECPVGKHFGISGIGEGVVWIASFLGPRDGQTHHLRFKVKGEQHSVSKVRTLASVDVEKLKNITEFIEYAVTQNRLEQGYDELFIKTVKTPTQKDIGLFIKWVNTDILKEESDTMESNGIQSKDIGKVVSAKARKWLCDRMTADAIS